MSDFNDSIDWDQVERDIEAAKEKVKQIVQDIFLGEMSLDNLERIYDSFYDAEVKVDKLKKTAGDNHLYDNLSELHSVIQDFRKEFRYFNEKIERISKNGKWY